MKTLYLHIGTPKTGTTSIQNFCVENKRLLERQGYCYPQFPFRYNKVSKVRNGHFLFGRIFDENGKRNEAQEQANYKQGMQMLHALFRTYDNIIISDEGIWYFMDDPKMTFWEDLEQEAKRGGFRIQVIVYLKRQEKLCISHWNQEVKLKKGGSSELQFDDAIKRMNLARWLNYYQKINQMAEVIGKENIIVRRFDRKYFKDGDLYADFFEQIGVSLTDEFTAEQDVRNQGLYGNTHEIKRILNGLPELSENSVNVFFMKRLWEISDISNQEYPSEMMSKEEIAALMENYNDYNNKLAEEYLGEPAGSKLFDEKIEDLPKWQKDNPYMYDDLVRFVGVIVIQLYKENKELKKELSELKKFASHVRHPFRTLFRRIKRKFGV